MAPRYRFGGVEFDSGTGELHPLGSRLPRQPARLLALLAESNGAVVSREEIRRLLWDDTTVEYDKSLHFCIHQIRSALGEPASEPRFVETIPRQGYRLIPAVERIDGAAHPPRASRRRVLFPLAIAGALLLGWVVVFNVGDAARAPSAPNASGALRIGVMPFVPPGDWPGGEFPTVAEWILEELAAIPIERLEVIGPATTATYDASDATIGELAVDYELDYIVNGRFLSDADPPSVLAELIRNSDGAHVWVKRYERFDDGRQIGVEIGRECRSRLPLDPEQPAR